MVHWRVSKRGACDRCRRHKLRCQPGGQNQDAATATCARCQRAGTACSFGIAKQPGRPSTSYAPGPQPRGGSPAARATDDRVDSSKLNDYFGEQVNSNGQAQNGQRTHYPCNGQFFRENTASQRRIEGSSRVLNLDPPCLNDLATTLDETSLGFPTWSHETLPPLCRNGVEATATLNPFGPGYGWPFENHSDIQIPKPASGERNKQFLDRSGNPFEAQANSTYSFTFDPPSEAIDFDYAASTSHPARSQPMKTSNAKHREIGDSEKGKRQLYGEASSIAIPAPSQGFPERHAVNDNEESVMEHRRMQELSNLAMDLYRQLTVRDAETQPSNAGATATMFQHQLVGSVLKSSNSFVALLSSFSESNAPSSPATTPSASRENSASSHSEREGSSSLASCWDQQDSSMSKDELAPSCSSDSRPADLTTVLQLLACYMRLVHLHSIMHSHILEYVLNFLPRRIDQPNDPIPPVFPGMQVDGISLDPFGPFQVMLVLRISLRVLGDVEVMLGLPEGCRIGERKSGVKGILGASVSARFVKAVMREEAWREKKLQRVRDRLENLWRVLEGY